MKNYFYKISCKLQTILLIRERITAANSTYPKVAVQWLNQALCYYQSFCLVDSEVLRNRHLRVAAKRSGKCSLRSHLPEWSRSLQVCKDASLRSHFPEHCLYDNVAHCVKTSTISGNLTYKPSKQERWT